MAAGDSWSEPIVVDNWLDFRAVSSYRYVKFANPHETGGTITLDGDGTVANPYIVNTYEEMLYATGASHIWQCKLINRGTRLYKYTDNNDNSIYCLYDASKSTIDFKTDADMPDGGYTDSVTINVYVDFNGWT
ncbi:MAG: hypothetical protein Q4A05_11170, partial [Ruminococcus sp.]|nr:hypothetical protein [Ruminococcus sp.]